MSGRTKKDLLLKTLRDVRPSRCSSSFTFTGQRVQEDSLHLEDNDSSPLETSETTNPTTQRHIPEDISPETTPLWKIQILQIYSIKKWSKDFYASVYISRQTQQ
jgi:hypothetical protein